MCSAIFFRISVIDSTRSPSAGVVAGATGTSCACTAGATVAADVWGACAAAAFGSATPPGAPDSMKLKMSFLVTRPLSPVPSSLAISTPCSCAILRTSGLDLVRRNSSAVAVALPFPAGWEVGGSGLAGAAESRQ